MRNFLADLKPVFLFYRMNELQTLLNCLGIGNLFNV